MTEYLSIVDLGPAAFATFTKAEQEWGWRAQAATAAEEAAELCRACIRLWSRGGSMSKEERQADVADEVADVLIMIAQLRQMSRHRTDPTYPLDWDFWELVQKRVHFKMERLRKKLNIEPLEVIG